MSSHSKPSDSKPCHSKLLYWKGWRALVLPLFIAIQCWAAQAHAGTRVLVMELGGPKAEALRDQLVKSLEDAGHTVVLSEQSATGSTKAELARLAKNAKAEAVVAGIVRRPSMRSWILTLRVYDADRGKRIGGEVRFQNSWLPGLAKELTDRAGAKLSKSLERAAKSTKRRRATGESDDDDDAASNVADEPAAAAEPEPELATEAELVPRAEASAASEGEAEGSESNPADDPGEVTDDQSGPSSAKPGRIIGAVTARAGLVHRKLDFSDDIYDRLRKQNANIWVYQVQAEVYPFDRPVADRLGLIARYEGVFSGNVKDSDYGGNFPVVYDELFAGLRARYPLGSNLVGFDLTFGRMRAGLEDPRHRANLPQVNYTQLRSSLDVDLDLGPVRATASAAFRLPLGYGEVSDDEWFPRVGGYGVEATGGLAYPLSKSIALEASASLRRYLLEMNAEPSDAIDGVAEVAGGAVDLYTAAYFGVNFRL